MRASNTQHGKRITALVFLLCFIMTALLSEAFILTHANHDHDHLGIGGGCAICAHIQSVEGLRRQFGAASFGVALAWAGLFAVAALLCCISAFRFSTPVCLKTRLNN